AVLHPPQGRDGRPGKSASSAHHVPVPAIRRQWRPHVLRRRLPSHVSPRCRLRCPGTQRYQARRSTGGASVEVRACDQPQGGQGDRHRHPADAARTHRRGDRVKRREFITLLGGAAASSCAWPFAALAQAPARRPRITFLAASQPRPTARVADAFLEGMRALGYTEGRDFEIEYRWAEGYLERLPALAEESVRRGTDVIVVGNIQSVIAARDATKTIPIVSALLDDPVALGLIKSDAKPGGNVRDCCRPCRGFPQNNSNWFVTCCLAPPESDCWLTPSMSAT